MAHFRERFLVLFMLVVIGVVTISMILLYVYFYVETEGHRNALIGRGDAVLDSLAAGIKSRGGYMRQCCLDRLGKTLEELAHTPLIKGVQVYHELTKASVKGGTVPEIGVVKPDSPFWEQGKLTLTKRYVFVPSEEESNPPPCDEEESSDVVTPPLWTCGTYFLTVVLNSSELDAMLRRDRVLFFITFSIIMVAIVLGMVTIRYRMRQEKLHEELLVTHERTLHFDRLAQLGAGLAHETKNPLNIVRGMAQAIEETHDTPAPVKRLASQIVDETDETVGRINAFLAFARSPKPVLASVSLHTFCEDLLALLKISAQHAGVTLINNTQHVNVMADEMLLRQVLLNLLNNALCATKKDGTVSIKSMTENGTLTLSITDTGCGISPEDLAHVTDPYFGHFKGGTGLGLSIVDQIAQSHGWTLHIKSTWEQGTTISLRGMKLGSSSI